MTDKQIIIDYKNLCENYSKEVGCYGTFDGSCIKEQCFTYKLLQQNNNLEKENIDLKLNLKKVINLSQKKNRQCYQFLADIKQLKRQHQADKGLITSTGKQNYQLLQEYDKLKIALTEIKEVLQFYNNITIGVDKGNGFFEIEVPKGNFSKFIYYYDTNPAKEALQKISEVEDG